jgi:hypothetical protein
LRPELSGIRGMASCMDPTLSGLLYTPSVGLSTKAGQAQLWLLVSSWRSPCGHCATTRRLWRGISELRHLEERRYPTENLCGAHER